MAAAWRVCLTDQVFPEVTIERELLAAAGAELVVARGFPADIVMQAREADGLLNTYLPLGAAEIAQLSRCRVISRYGIGTDNIDIAAAELAGIVVTNVPDYCVEEVAAHTVALILSLVRRIPDGSERVRQGGWGLDGLRPIERISETTLGLVGFGRIGQRVARVARELGFRLLAYDPLIDVNSAGADLGVVAAEFRDLLRRSDVVSLHLPLTPQTRGVVDAAALSLMRPHTVLINTSRGGLVDLAALVKALRAGSLRGAGLDVLPSEPPVDSYADVPGLLITPHVAYYSEAAIRESQRKAATQVVKVLTGQVPDYRVSIGRSGT